MKHGWLFALALVGCPGDEPLPAAENRCTQQFECISSSAECDPTLHICVHERATRPYRVALQIVPPTEPPGRPLARKTLDTTTFAGTWELGEVAVPHGVIVRGQVLERAGGPSVEAEVAFTPTAGGYLTTSVSAFTRPTEPATTPRTHVFTAVLEPNTSYTARVFPLGAASERLAPSTFPLTTTAADQGSDFVYPPQTRLRVRFEDENLMPPPSGLKVRLRHKQTGEVASSIGTTSDHTADLFAPVAVLDALYDYELVLGLERLREPWLVAIIFDGERIRVSPAGENGQDRSASLIMPQVPTPVSLLVVVEIAQPALTKVGAEVTLVSNFVPPAGRANASELDWCRLRRPTSPQGTFRCTARVIATMDEQRTFKASLLPGDYQIIVVPIGQGDGRMTAAARSTPQIVEAQDGGVQGPITVTLPDATLYPGNVLLRRRQPMPLVTVTAQALRVPDPQLGEIARYNRTATASTDRSGEFRLAVDPGYYDLLAMPPEGSGFPWILPYYDTRITGDMAGEQLTLSAEYPVLARGTLATEQGQSLANARVEAFAIVPDGDTGRDRAVRIARALSDEDGAFVLQLPPYIGAPPSGSTELDAGFTLDGSALPATASDADAGAQR